MFIKILLNVFKFIYLTMHKLNSKKQTQKSFNNCVFCFFFFLHSSVFYEGIKEAIPLEIWDSLGVSLSFICMWSKHTIVWFIAYSYLCSFVLYKAGSTIYFALLYRWLKWVNAVFQLFDFMPLRLLYIITYQLLDQQ